MTYLNRDAADAAIQTHTQLPAGDAQPAQTKPPIAAAAAQPVNEATWLTGLSTLPHGLAPGTAEICPLQPELDPRMGIWPGPLPPAAVLPLLVPVVYGAPQPPPCTTAPPFLLPPRIVPAGPPVEPHFGQHPLPSAHVAFERAFNQTSGVGPQHAAASHALFADCALPAQLPPAVAMDGLPHDDGAQVAVTLAPEPVQPTIYMPPLPSAGSMDAGKAERPFQWPTAQTTATDASVDAYRLAMGLAIVPAPRWQPTDLSFTGGSSLGVPAAE